MSVINSAFDLRLAHGPCTLCGHQLQYPYLEWHRDSKEGQHISICGKCCQKIRKGFTADLIQVTASMDIRQLNNGPRYLLTRTSMDELIDEHMEEYRQAEGDEAADKLMAKIKNNRWGPPAEPSDNE